MPHETNDQKSKLFLFDLLSKKQKIRSDLARTVTAGDLFNSIFKNENKKLFLDSKILTRLEAINSTIIVSGYLKGKTCFTDEKKNYFILRKYNNEMRSKFLLECYKDSSLKKAKYLIDIDYVDQIDLKETENKIILTRDSEHCTLDTGDKRSAFLWLNKICRNCGFDEITNQQELTNKQVPKLKKTNQQLINKHNSTNSSLQENDSSSDAKNLSTNNNSSSSSSNSSNKPVAGIAALSVGSFHVKLDNIFRKKSATSLKTKKKSTSENEIENRKENYVFLKECMSGLDNDDINSNKSTEITQSKLNDNNNSSDVFYDSFNSLDRYSSNRLKQKQKLLTLANRSVLIDSNSIPSSFKGNNQLFKSTSSNHDQINDKQSIGKTSNETRINSFTNDDRYINYSHRFEEDSQDINKNTNQYLKYVPLEIIDNTDVQYTRVYTDDLPKSSQSILTSRDLNKEYTDWDAFRTKALKNTQEEFQFHRTHKESVF